MKNILIYVILVLGIIACKDQDIKFDDFDYQTVYFPFQLPLRTLSIGEDRIDNTLDKKYQFDIGVSIGGMYATNHKNWTVGYMIDNSLTDGVYNIINNDTNKVISLPASYYTLEPKSSVTIPKGLFNGRIRIQLTEAFFDDSLALTGEYVIPLVITETSADSILTGLSAISGNPDRRIASDWESGKSPKDWVLFGIKYINGYHGSYLQRGRDIIYSGGNPIDTVVYRDIHVERDNVVALKSAGKTTAITNFIGQNISDKGQYAMNLRFLNMWGTPGGEIVISPTSKSVHAVTGNGLFFDKEKSDESIIGLPMQSMHLNYTYKDGEKTHVVTDTLIFRDRGLKFEENSFKISRNGGWY